MSKSLTQIYGSQATTPNSSYPGGTFKDKTGSQSGTPLQRDWAIQIDGFFQKIMADSGMGYNGNDETALSSQFLTAMHYQLNRSTKPPTWGIEDVCSGLHSTYDITRPDLAPNLLIGLGTIRDACVGIDRDSQVPIIYVLNSSDEVVPITGSLSYGYTMGAGAALSLDYTAATMESVRSICCDGESLYVLWRSTGNTYWVTSFDIKYSSGYPVNWSKNLNMDYSTDEEYSKIIIASSLHLAVSSDNISGKCGVAIVPRSGTGSAAKGSGNGVSSPVSSSNGRIVSDGSHVYWLSRVINGTNHDVRLCSAKIVDPTVSDYTGGVIYSALSAFYNYLPKAIYNFGGSYGTVVCAGPTGSFHLLVKSEDEIKYCITIDNHEWYSDVQDYNVVSGCDGYNLWLQLHQHSEVYDEARLAFAKIPLTQFVKSNTSTTEQDYTANMVLTNISTGVTTGDEPGRLLFDGADMWFISRSGFVCRITNPGMR
jgi:hypothetical protein